MENEKNDLINKSTDDIISMVNDGDINAINELAYRYCYGEGIEENKEKAYQLYKNASEKGSVKAKFNLAMCYYNGDGTEKNSALSFEMFKELAEKHNHYRSYYYLGELYFWGDLGEIDYEKAFFYYNETLKINPEFLNAKFCIAYAYYSGKGVEQDYETAFNMLNELIEKHEYKDAYFYIGELYYLGRLGNKDYEKANLYFNKSIEYGKNIYASKYYLGEIYMYGKGVPADFSKAKMYFEEILDEKHCDAYYKLALLHTGEYGLDKNDNKFKEYMNKIEFDLCISLIYYVIALKPEEEQNIEEILKMLKSEMEMAIFKETLEQFPENHPAKVFHDRLSYLAKEEYADITEKVKSKILACENNLNDAIMSLSSDEDVINLTKSIIGSISLLKNNVNIKKLTLQNGNYLASELIEIESNNDILKCNYIKTQNLLSENPKEESRNYDIANEDVETIYNLIQKINFNDKVSNDDYLEGGSAGKLIIEFENGTKVIKEFGSYMPEDITDLYQFIVNK